MQFDIKANDLFIRRMEELKDEFEIIKIKGNEVKQGLTFNGQPIYYSVVFSKKIGIILFLNLFNVEELNTDDVIDDVIDQYELFEKRMKEDLSKLNFENNLKPELTIYVYFPQLEPNYFDGGLVVDKLTDNISYLKKHSTDNLIGRMDSTNRIKAFFNNIPNNENNKLIEEENNYIKILTLFTNETSLDMTQALDFNNQNLEISLMLRRFALDEDQVAKIENNNSENRLILSQAGTGKSVILFSKAQRMAILNPNKRFLIIAYNKYLVDEYNAKKHFQNLKNNQLDILTFDKLLKDNYNGEYDFDRRDEIFIEILSSINNIKKYSGIYVDEVQLFKKEWLNFLYNLLESKEKEKYTFVLAGDINQSVNKRGQTPWRNTDIPSFTGRRISLNKLYRATEDINNFSKELAKNIYTVFHRRKYEITADLKDEGYELEAREDNELLDLRDLELNDVVFFETSQNVTFDHERNRTLVEDRYDDIVKKIIEIRDSGVDLREMVILFPFAKLFDIEYIKIIKEKLNKEEIDVFVSLEDETNEENNNYNGNRNWLSYNDIKSALSLVSVGKVTGIDFSHVMVIGLDSYGTSIDFKEKETQLDDDSLDEETFREHISKLYVQMTRARRKLYIEVPNSFPRGQNNIYKKIIFGRYL